VGKASKKRRSETRKKMKKAAKEAKKALYKSYSDRGKERKKSGGNLKASLIRHPVRPCGNIGCKKCYPQYSRVAA